MAEEKGIPVVHKSAQELEKALPGTKNQGILAMAEPFAYKGLQDIIRLPREKDCGLVIVADHITDEGNLGALIRSAAFFGAHGMVLPKDRSARVTEKVIKRSSGACAHLPVAVEVNLGRALDILNKEGFWIIGAAGEGEETLYDFDWKRDLALVLGSEDRGLSRSVRDRCHQVVRIPRLGRVDSLNVSVAGGIVLSEITRQRAYAQ
jgi:23S rRNA (guanosine2251-2'-O)-methyltransferase